MIIFISQTIVHTLNSQLFTVLSLVKYTKIKTYTIHVCTKSRSVTRRISEHLFRWFKIISNGLGLNLEALRDQDFNSSGQFRAR